MHTQHWLSSCLIFFLHVTIHAMQLTLPAAYWKCEIVRLFPWSWLIYNDCVFSWFVWSICISDLCVMCNSLISCCCLDHSRCSTNWSGTQCERPAPKSSKSEHISTSKCHTIIFAKVFRSHFFIFYVIIDWYKTSNDNNFM